MKNIKWDDLSLVKKVLPFFGILKATPIFLFKSNFRLSSSQVFLSIQTEFIPEMRSSIQRVSSYMEITLSVVSRDYPNSNCLKSLYFHCEFILILICLADCVLIIVSAHFC